MKEIQRIFMPRVAKEHCQLESYQLGIDCGEKSSRAWTWVQSADGRCRRSSRGQGHRHRQRSPATPWCKRIPGWLVRAKDAPTQPTADNPWHNNDRRYQPQLQHCNNNSVNHNTFMYHPISQKNQSINQSKQIRDSVRKLRVQKTANSQV